MASLSPIGHECVFAYQSIESKGVNQAGGTAMVKRKETGSPARHWTALAGWRETTA